MSCRQQISSICFVFLLITASDVHAESFGGTAGIGTGRDPLGYCLTEGITAMLPYPGSCGRSGSSRRGSAQVVREESSKEREKRLHEEREAFEQSQADARRENARVRAVRESVFFDHSNYLSRLFSSERNRRSGGISTVPLTDINVMSAARGGEIRDFSRYIDTLLKEKAEGRNPWGC